MRSCFRMRGILSLPPASQAAPRPSFRARRPPPPRHPEAAPCPRPFPRHHRVRSAVLPSVPLPSSQAVRGSAYWHVISGSDPQGVCRRVRHRRGLPVSGNPPILRNTGAPAHAPARTHEGVRFFLLPESETQEKLQDSRRTRAGSWHRTSGWCRSARFGREGFVCEGAHWPGFPEAARRSRPQCGREALPPRHG